MTCSCNPSTPYAQRCADCNKKNMASKPYASPAQGDTFIRAPIGSRVARTVPPSRNNTKNADGSIQIDILLSPNAGQAAGGTNTVALGGWPTYTVARLTNGVVAPNLASILVQNSRLANNGGVADTGNATVFGSFASIYGVQINELYATGVGTNAQASIQSLIIDEIVLNDETTQSFSGGVGQSRRIFEFLGSRCDQNQLQTPIPLEYPSRLGNEVYWLMSWTSTAAGAGDAIRLQIKRAYLGSTLGSFLMDAPQSVDSQFAQGCR